VCVNIYVRIKWGKLNRMADMTIEELEKFSKGIAKTTKALDSSAITIIKGEKDTKKRNVLIKQYVELLEKQLRTDKDLNKFQKSAIRQQINETKNSGSSLQLLGKAGKFAKEELTAFAKGLAATAGKFLDRETKVTGFSTIVEEVGGVTGKVLKELAETADFNRGVFKQLALSGADFGKDVIALGEAANRARMPLLEFVDLVQTNSTTFAQLFGTVQQGVNAVEGFTAELTDVTMKEFAQFGLNVEETNEFLATFLELERARGRTQQITQAELIAGTTQYTKNLIRLTKLTGQEITQIDDNIRAQAVDGQFQAKLAKLVAEGRTEEARRLNETAGALRGISPAFEQFFKDIVTTGTVTTESNQKLAGVSTELFETVKRFIGDPSISEADFISELRKEGQNLLKTSGLEIAAAFDPAIKEALDVAAALTGVTETFDKKRIDLNKVLEDDLKARGEFSKATTEIVKGLDATRLFQVGVQEVTLEGLKKLFGTGSVLESINNYLQGGENLVEKASNVFGKLETIKGALKTYIVELPGKFMEYATAGEDGRNLADNVLDLYPEIPGIQFFKTKKNEALAQKIRGEKNMEANVASGQAMASGLVEDFQTGSNGFRDFGSGTPAMLHGVEAVVPKNDMSQLLKVIKSTLDNTGPDPVVNRNSASAGITNTAIEDLNKNVTRALNTLITVSAMTEKNTKATNNNLANMSGSLV